MSDTQQELLRLVHEAHRLLIWAANDFDRARVSNDDWRSEFEFFEKHELSRIKVEPTDDIQ